MRYDPDDVDALAAEVADERRRQLDDGYDLAYDYARGGPLYAAALAQQYLARGLTESAATFEVGASNEVLRRRLIQAAAVILAAVEVVDAAAPADTEADR